MTISKEPRASWKPSATTLGATGGTSTIMALWSLVAVNTDMSNINFGLGTIVVGGVGAGLSA